ncbi:hypothetical protein [Gilvimarinus polysaccharolyticus]|uniref:hypothetical protein n=1 Tax=Gilvimarinus polysaccharolyticus TaxID=863921 RepID=UPI0006736F1B|nr:hypothetical protein [Gilvimarinus polysaccharolyticus]
MSKTKLTVALIAGVKLERHYRHGASQQRRRSYGYRIEFIQLVRKAKMAKECNPSKIMHAAYSKSNREQAA